MVEEEERKKKRYPLMMLMILLLFLLLSPTPTLLPREGPLSTTSRSWRCLSEKLASFCELSLFAHSFRSLSPTFSCKKLVPLTSFRAQVSSFRAQVSSLRALVSLSDDDDAGFVLPCCPRELARS